MSHFIPAAPNTRALMGYSHDDIIDGAEGAGLVETMVFAFKMVQEENYCWAEPVTQMEFERGSGEIGPAIEMPDGRVVWENEIYDTRNHFERHCSWVFEQRRKEAKKAADRKALKDLL